MVPIALCKWFWYGNFTTSNSVPNLQVPKNKGCNSSKYPIILMHHDGKIRDQFAYSPRNSHIPSQGTFEDDYTTWKVDGATPCNSHVLVYRGPLLIHLLGVVSHLLSVRCIFSLKVGYVSSQEGITSHFRRSPVTSPWSAK